MRSSYLQTSSSSDSESSSGEYEWVEKKSDTSKVVRQRDDWMMGDSFVPSYTLQEKKREKKQSEKDTSVIEKVRVSPSPRTERTKAVSLSLLSVLLVSAGPEQQGTESVLEKWRHGFAAREAGETNGGCIF